MFERALWITAAKTVPATLSIAAHGQGVSYINGVRVPDSYRLTQPKNPMKTVPYRVYDLTDMLQPGRNAA